MILMVSGRTDIPAFYSKWFMNRYKEGFLDIRNPFFEKNVSRIYFEDVDLILFCSKNPLPIIPFLKEINNPIIFHITLTPYKKDIEPNVIPKGKIIEGIKEISRIIGKENTVVRYDPILINDNYTVDYHIKAFDNLCDKLDGYVESIIVSFVDDYKNTEKNMSVLRLQALSNEDYKKIGLSFTESAKKHNMTVQTCFEDNNLTEYGFIKRDCIPADIVFKKTGISDLKVQNIRTMKKCKCVQTVDVGYYNSCNHMCKYCYANFDEKKVKDNMLKHNPNSSLLIGELNKDDIIKIRKQ